jgi:hypothetical protein
MFRNAFQDQPLSIRVGIIKKIEGNYNPRYWINKLIDNRKVSKKIKYPII